MLPTTGSKITAGDPVAMSGEGLFQGRRHRCRAAPAYRGPCPRSRRASWARPASRPNCRRPPAGYRRGRDSCRRTCTIIGRPVYPRARRMALIVASVPELTSRTFSTEGTASMISSASSVSGQGRGAVARAAADGGLQGGDDRRMAMAEDHRAPGADVVEVAVAVDIEQLAPCAASEKIGSRRRRRRPGPGCSRRRA